MHWLGDQSNSEGAYAEDRAPRYSEYVRHRQPNTVYVNNSRGSRRNNTLNSSISRRDRTRAQGSETKRTQARLIILFNRISRILQWERKNSTQVWRRLNFRSRYNRLRSLFSILYGSPSLHFWKVVRQGHLVSPNTKLLFSKSQHCLKIYLVRYYKIGIEDLVLYLFCDRGLLPFYEYLSLIRKQRKHRLDSVAWRHTVLGLIHTVSRFVFYLSI